MSSTIVDELVTILGIDLDAQALNKLHAFEDNVGKAAQAVEKFALKISLGATAMSFWLKTSYDEEESLQRIADRTGVSTNKLQEWGYAANAISGDAQGLMADMESLQKSMSSPIPGQYNPQLLMLLGFAKALKIPLTSVDQILMAISAKIHGIANPNLQRQWTEMFGSDKTFLLLKKGPEYLKKLFAEAHAMGTVLSPEQLKAAQDFNIAFRENEAAFSAASQRLAGALLPELNNLVGAFKKWIVLNEAWIKVKLEAVIKGVAKGFTQFVEVMQSVWAWFKSVIEKLKEMFPSLKNIDMVAFAVKGTLLLMVGSLGALALAMTPFLAKAALVAAALGLIASKGKEADKALGGASKSKYPHLAKAINDISKESWKTLKIMGEFAWKVAKGMAQGALEVFDHVMKGLDGLLKSLIDVVNTVIARLKKFDADAKKQFGDAPAPALSPGAMRHYKNWLDTIKGWFPEFSQPYKKQTSSGQTINDNKTVNIMMATGDPLQAAQQLAKTINAHNINAPGMFAPVTS